MIKKILKLLKKKRKFFREKVCLIQTKKNLKKNRYEKNLYLNFLIFKKINLLKVLIKRIFFFLNKNFLINFIIHPKYKKNLINYYLELKKKFKTKIFKKICPYLNFIKRDLKNSNHKNENFFVPTKKLNKFFLF